MIRQAVEADTEQIIAMLNRYKLATPLECLKDATEETARMILTMIFTSKNGIILVSSDSRGDLTGLLIAIKNINIWDRRRFCMNELAYWVNPEARGTSAGYRLLKTYTDICEIMKKSGEITYYTISKMVNSPDLNYERFGFSKLEETWSN
jgi:N-acetylglutamate synthase-like GNAT family acetyltransferase